MYIYIYICIYIYHIYIYIYVYTHTYTNDGPSNPTSIPSIGSAPAKRVLSPTAT